MILILYITILILLHYCFDSLHYRSHVSFYRLFYALIICTKEWHRLHIASWTWLLSVTKS